MAHATPAWQTLQQSADRHRQAAEHQQAIDLYTQALAQPGVPWEAQSTLTMARADSHMKLGDLAAMDADLTALAAQAASHRDHKVRAAALAELALALRYSGDMTRCLQVGREALEAAEESQLLGLQAEALTAIGIAQIETGDFEAAKATLQAAEALPLTQGDVPGKVKVDYLKVLNLVRIEGEYQQAVQTAQHGLQLAQASGLHNWEGIFLNNIAISVSDLALQGSLMEQTLEIFESLGDRPRQCMMLMNIAAFLMNLGLYSQASDYIRQALAMARDMHQEHQIIFALQFLGQAHLETGRLPDAHAALDEGLALVEKTNARLMQSNFLLIIAMVFLAAGKPQKALETLEKAVPLSENLPSLSKANLLAYQSAARQLAGDGSSARQLAMQAVDLISPEDFGNTEILVDELFWWCYRALAPERRASSKTITDERWRVLDLGRQAMLASVQNMSDAGLRRGYLHRVRYRRLLVNEWLKWAPSRAGNEALAAFTSQVQRPGRLKDVFQRLLKEGVRLNIQRDVSRLPREIVEQVAELTGAERIALVLVDPQGARRKAEVLLPFPPYPAMSGRVEAPPDSEAFLVEVESWLEQASAGRQGILRILNPDAELTHQRSLLVAPLISQSRLVGIIYADLTGCYGRFEQEDLDLLVVLANQSAVAIENADWSSTLEQRVNERTTELEQSTLQLRASNQSLEQRNNELAIINEIQQGLASKLEFRAIIDLVGDRINTIFAAENTSISLYDQDARVSHILYSLTQGIRDPDHSMPLGPGLTSWVIETRQPLLIGTIQEAEAKGAVIMQVGREEDESPIESNLFVPLLARDQVIGVVKVGRSEKNFYTENDLRLLQTLAASLSVALENARLFDETKRLLKETEQRSSELAILNSVGEAMAKTLDVKTVTRIVGDKVRDIFDAEVVSILLLDPQTNLIHTQYEYDQGEGGYVDYLQPFPLGEGLTSKVIAARQPLLLGTLEEQAEHGARLAPELIEKGTGVITQSWLGVPIIVGDRVLGVVGLGDYQPHAFTENHVRLLQTLSSNMGVTIANARLFQSEQQRAAELAIINSVQAALAAELNIQGIYDAVGDKIREIFHQADIGIRIYDPQTSLLHFPYTYENGQRIEIEFYAAWQ